jgi:hypothetical protein
MKSLRRTYSFDSGVSITGEGLWWILEEGAKSGCWLTGDFGAELGRGSWSVGIVPGPKGGI